MPGTVSNSIAAIVAGPTACTMRSRECSARSDSCSLESDQNSLRYAKGPKQWMCPVEYSLGMRRQSPVAAIAAPVLPWYER